MASELLVKRLLKQAGVSVFAGLLLSSAVMAEDSAADAGDTGDVSVGIGDDGIGMGAPAVEVDPVFSGDDGDDAADPDDGTWDDGDADPDDQWDDAAEYDTSEIQDRPTPICDDCTEEEPVAIEDSFDWVTDAEITWDIRTFEVMDDGTVLDGPIAMQAGSGPKAVNHGAVTDSRLGRGRDGDYSTHRPKIVK